jgi:hypothetical protein
MRVEAVADPKGFIESLGLHDVRIHRIELDPKARSITLSVPDLLLSFSSTEN